MSKILDLEFTEEELTLINRCLEQIDENIAREPITPLERINLTLKHKEPDRVPVMLSSMEHNSRSLGVTISEILKDPIKAILADLAFIAGYASDGVIPYADPHVVGTEEMGTKIFYPEDSTAILKEFPVKELKNIEKLVIPDPYRDGKLPMVMQIIHFLHEKIGEKIFLWQPLDGPFGLAGDLIGSTQLCKNLKNKPELVHALMERCTEAIIIIAKAVQDAGAMPLPFDAMSSPEFIGRENYLEFAFPYQQKVIQSLTPPGSFLGINGDVKAIIEEYTAIGALGIMIEGGKEFVGSGLTLKEIAAIKLRTGQRTTLLTQGIKTNHFLWGTSEEISLQVKKIMDELAFGGGFILTTDVLPLDTKPENVKAVVEATKKYGKYHK